MRLLCVPNWSFCDHPDLESAFRDVFGSYPVKLHYIAGDVDHNRTVTAFSGDASFVQAVLFELANLALPLIDLRTHRGVHPRIGALDVCPFIVLDHSIPDQSFVDETASFVASKFGLPIYFYEHSEKGRHEADLPTLRKGQFEGMEGKALFPDYGPSERHPRLGATVMGFRDFLIAMNVFVTFGSRPIAKEIRQLRAQGDDRFLGVRALGLTLSHRGCEQVSMNLSMPDQTFVDPIIHWISEKAGMLGARVTGTELIGVIREKDCGQATSLLIHPDQVI